MNARRTVPPIDDASDDVAPNAEVIKRNRKASLEIRWRLSNNLKRVRELRGLTQEELADLCGLKKNYISNVEQATVNITLANLETLARGLGCTEVELLRKLPNP